MATRTSSLAPTNSSDANFRLWINEIHNALIAFGWVQTSDTGQINFSTVTRPTAINTYQGYAVYRMADSLQSTCAVFMRIDFGTAGITDAPGVKVKVGIGSTDGAGTLTGNLATTFTSATNSSASATLANCRCSGSTSSFRMHFWGTSLNNQGWTVIIERERDAAGIETSLGIHFIFCHPVSSGNVGKASQFLELAGGTGTQDAIWYAMISLATSQAAGGVVGIGPVRTQLGPMRNPMLGAFVCARTDFTMEATYPVTIYGASHTYLMLRGNGASTAATLNGVNVDSAFGMLWE